ncbi:oxidoreductase [Guyanagaster necrorhizus]|uniref:Oxidoreductase n=1 Tax=Guyanagaster necrorhizus TaxID=856835 RepID=A0A9P7W4B2_9AGAR|nr:oxidoreductase [Guyanagaster necrorhizus MCA 3950]KAG7452387.1 oxidoreductase [Guyanagaster necrorhizus MCA 3950]
MPKNCVVVVTGCSTGGIGFALCERFAQQGCKVYATSRNVETMQGFKDPNGIEILALDVTSDEDVQRVIQHISDTEGRVDIVVNNAATPAIGPLIDQSMEIIKRTYNTNTFSVIRMCKTVIPIMAKRHSGLIVNIGSIVGEIPTPWHGAYSSSKAAVQNISEVLSMECRPLGINVMHVAPGSVTSNFSRNQEKWFSLPENTLYATFLPNIMERMYASQTKSSMSNEEFAKHIVDKALAKPPPSYISVGGNALLFWVFKWLPRAWVLGLLWRLYSKKE